MTAQPKEATVPRVDREEEPAIVKTLRAHTRAQPPYQFGAALDPLQIAQLISWLDRGQPEPAEAPRPHPAAEAILCQLFTYPLSLGLTEAETQAGLAELRELLRGRVRDETLDHEPSERGLGAEEGIRNEHALYRDAWERHEESQADCKAIRNENARLRAEVTRLNELAAKEKAEHAGVIEQWRAALTKAQGDFASMVDSRNAFSRELVKAKEENARLTKELRDERERLAKAASLLVAVATLKSDHFRRSFPVLHQAIEDFLQPPPASAAKGDDEPHAGDVWEVAPGLGMARLWKKATIRRVLRPSEARAVTEYAIAEDGLETIVGREKLLRRISTPPLTDEMLADAAEAKGERFTRRVADAGPLEATVLASPPPTAEETERNTAITALLDVIEKPHPGRAGEFVAALERMWSRG